jgi:hypothetical protein
MKNLHLENLYKLITLHLIISGRKYEFLWAWRKLSTNRLEVGIHTDTAASDASTEIPLEKFDNLQKYVL